MSELLNNFDKRCRVCLDVSDSNIELNNVVIIEDEGVMLSHILELCGSLEICDDDHKPQAICMKCIVAAQNSYSFRNTCIQTDVLLQNELSKVYLNEADVPEELESKFIDTSLIKEELPSQMVEDDEDTNTTTFDDVTLNESTDKLDTKPEKIFPCGLCSKAYTKMGSLRAHRNRFHVRPKQLTKNIKTLRCKLCEFKGDSLLRFMGHMPSHVQKTNGDSPVDQNLLPPRESEIWVTTLNEYNRGCGVDMKLVETVAYLITTEDDGETETRDGTVEVDDTKRVDMVEDDEGEHVCELCDNVMKSRADLLQHIEYVHKAVLSVNQFTCSFCDFSCNSKLLMKTHKNAEHSDEKLHNCSFCKSKFFTVKELQTHENKHKQKYTCEFCGHTCNDSSNFKAHTRIHTGEKPYECDECDKKFAQWSTLKYHKITHSAERTFVCEVCGMSFKSPSTLRSHTMRVHCEERPHACSLCEKTFKIKDQLRLHMRYRHHNERNYVCNTCGKAFHKMFTLRTHERVHTGERPYSCEICERTFTQRCVLKSHMNSVHATEGR